MSAPGENVVFRCSCDRANPPGSIGCGELHVIPIVVDGERRVDLRTIGAGGCVLSRKDRKRLRRILADPDWFGA